LKRHSGKYVFISILGIIVVIFSVIYFKSKLMISPKNRPEVTLIQIDSNKDGQSSHINISYDEISDELNENLLSILYDTNIRNKMIPLPNSYTLYDGSTYITIKISADDAIINIYLCNDKQYSYVEINANHYWVVNAEDVYENVYRVLFD